MKKLLIFFALILATAATSFAGERVVSATTISNWTFGGPTATIRIYIDKTIVTSAPVRTIVAGTTVGFYKTINCTVASTTLSCDSFTIDTTTDSNVPNAKFIADLYDSNGRVRGRLFDRFSVSSALGSPTTWEAMRLAQPAGSVILPSTYYTSSQVDGLILGKKDDSMPTNRILGRTTAGTGVIENITVGSGLTLAGGTLAADTAVTALPSTALRCLASTGHINHGFFWQPGKEYHDFYWDTLVRPWDTANTGYLISAGYGGAHNLLLGFLSNGTHFAVTGNIFDGVSNKTFQTTTKFPLGNWYHIAVAWDRNNIIVSVDGVSEAIVSHIADSRSVAGIETPNLYVCGSNHSKFDLDVAWIRGFENVNPLAGPFGMSTVPFRPQRYPLSTFYNYTGSGYQNAVFLADYTKPSHIIPDLSEGLSSGLEQLETNTVAITAVTVGNARNVITWNGLPGSPVTVTTALAGGETAAQVGAAMRSSLSTNGTIGTFFVVGGSGADITLKARLAQENDPTANFTIEDVTSDGITDDVTSADTTAGYAGKRVKHPGVREGLIGTTGTFGDANQTNESEEDLPAWTTAVIAKPTPIAQATPTGAPLVYDTFSRISVPFWDNVIGLGSTMGGSSGVLAWQNAIAYGTTSAGQAYPVNSSNSMTYVDLNGVVNVDARWNEIEGCCGDYYHQHVDADNFIAVQILGATQNLYVRNAGVTVVPWSTVAGTTATSVRIVTSGTTLTLYLNGSQVYTGTQTMPGGDRYGFDMISGQMSKLGSMVIY